MKCRGDDLTPNMAFFSTLVGDRAFFSRGRGATSGQVTNGMSNCGCAESGGKKKKEKKGKKTLNPCPIGVATTATVFIFIRHAGQTVMIYLSGCTRSPETFGKYKISCIRVLTDDSKNPLAEQTRRGI